MNELFYTLLGVASVLAAGCFYVILFVALLALINGTKEIMKKEREDKHE